MPLERFFAESASGVMGTAAKILYLVRDFASQKSDACLALTNSLVKGDKLIEVQELALLAVIDYKKYQSLSDERRGAVKKSIAKKLFDESNNYSTKHFVKMYNNLFEHIRTENHESKGLQYNCKIGIAGFSRDNSIKVLAICYPEKLFLDPEKLSVCMAQVIVENNFNLLTSKGKGIYESFKEREKAADDYKLGVSQKIFSFFNAGVYDERIPKIISDYLLFAEEAEYKSATNLTLETDSIIDEEWEIDKQITPTISNKI